ncbi:MAG: response regulator transcription factor [Rhodovulum sp.]|nr:response regulator transcription factor [Rhodovulum sp.]
MIESRTRPDGTLDDSPPDLDLARMAGALEQAVLGQNTLARHIERPVAVRSLPAEPYDERHPPLSKRQWEVLSLMTHGLTNVEIARRLGLSPNTVKIHVSGILARLGLPSRTQAVHWALSQTEDDTTSDQPDRT